MEAIFSICLKIISSLRFSIIEQNKMGFVYSDYKFNYYNEYLLLLY